MKNLNFINSIRLPFERIHSKIIYINIILLQLTKNQYNTMSLCPFTEKNLDQVNIKMEKEKKHVNGVYQTFFIIYGII